MSLVGRLEDLALPDIFQILSLGRKSGCLLVEAAAGTAAVLFKNGTVVRCEADFLDTDVGDDLVAAGALDAETLEDIRSSTGDGGADSLGRELLARGVVDHELLQRVARHRVERIVYHLIRWEKGEFRFELEAESLPSAMDKRAGGIEIDRGMSPEFLLMEGARVYDEQRRQTQGEPPGPSGEQRPPAGGTTEESSNDEDGVEDFWGDWSREEERKGDISSLRALSAELRFPSNTSEITLLILRFASDIFQRGVLFMVGRGEAVGLGQFGLNVEDADVRVRSVRVSLRESDFFRARVEERIHYEGELPRDPATERMVAALGGEWPDFAHVFPIVAEGRVVVLLYCDNLPSGTPLGNWEGLEVFAHQAGLAIEKALLERRLRRIESRGA